VDILGMLQPFRREGEEKDTTRADSQSSFTYIMYMRLIHYDDLSRCRVRGRGGSNFFCLYGGIGIIL